MSYHVDAQLCLGTLYEHLDTDVFAYNVATAIEQEKCEQTTHAAIAIIEWMNREEVKHEHRNQQQGIILAFVQGFVEC